MERCIEEGTIVKGGLDTEEINVVRTDKKKFDEKGDLYAQVERRIDENLAPKEKDAKGNGVPQEYNLACQLQER